MSVVITNSAKSNKPIISGTSEAQKAVNSAILAAVKNKISPKKD
jgi:hypothetical protein